MNKTNSTLICIIIMLLVYVACIEPVEFIVPISIKILEFDHETGRLEDIYWKNLTLPSNSWMDNSFPPEFYCKKDNKYRFEIKYGE